MEQKNLKNNILSKFFIQKLQHFGKQTKAEKVLHKTFIILEKKFDKNPYLILEQAIIKILPKVILINKRLGSSIYRISKKISLKKSILLSISWIIKSSLLQKQKSFSYKLALEIFDIINNQGETLKLKKQFLKTIYLNRMFNFMSFNYYNSKKLNKINLLKKLRREKFKY